jgi:mono/diheme cytochrome c family protein
MKQAGRPLAALVALAVAAPLVARGAEAPPRPSGPALDYMLHCQGCHKPDGSGQGDVVPALRGQMGRFLHDPGGREFLVRVPGVAQSQLDDKALAEVLNWMLVRFDRANLPVGFTPFTEREVGALRSQPLSDTKRRRASLVAKISAFRTLPRN